MIGGFIRYFLGRRLARLLPGGWLAVLLLSPTVRNAAKRGWARYRSRGLPPGPPNHY